MIKIQEKIDLILAINHICDTLPEPEAMLSAIANILADYMKVELCLLSLLDRETKELELKAIFDRSELLDKFGSLNGLRLSQKIIDTVSADDVAVWEGNNVLPAVTLERLPGEIQIAGIPIVISGGQRLGVLLLVRTGPPFNNDDVELLRTAEKLIDSAVIQGYAYYDLQQRNKELETIYRIDHIRDLQLSFDDMLHRVLKELLVAIQAETAFVTLYDWAGKKLELRASTNENLFKVASFYKTVDRIANEALEQGELVYHNNIGDKLHSIICIPLIFNEKIIGVLGVVNRLGQQGFRGEDRRMLKAIGSQMDTAIFESLEKNRLRQVLGRAVDPRVMERILSNPDVGFLAGERAELSVLYADLRGSTNLAENTEPELLVEFINDYLGRMTDVIISWEGTLDKFIGDEVMALFGAPFPQADHALRAVRVGLEMQAIHNKLMADWQQRNFSALPIGIGIATGELIVGEMGCPRRTDYTVIGQAANLGARICSIAKGGQLLISQATYDLIKNQVEAIPITSQQFKGVNSPVTVYDIARIIE